MISVSTLISVLSVIISLIVAMATLRRNNKADVKSDAVELTTLIVKLENINDDTKEIKNELKSIRNEVGDLRERVTVAEQTAKSLHKRVDMMQTTMKNQNEKEINV